MKTITLKKPTNKQNEINNYQWFFCKTCFQTYPAIGDIHLKPANKCCKEFNFVGISNYITEVKVDIERLKNS